MVPECFLKSAISQVMRRSQPPTARAVQVCGSMKGTNGIDAVFSRVVRCQHPKQ